MTGKFYAAALLCAMAAWVPAMAQPAAPAAIHASASAENFVAGNITRGLGILSDTALSEQQRSQQFEAMLLDLTDMKRIALFTLGNYAKSAAPADQDAFVAAFQDYSQAMYRSYFNRFGGQKLVVTGSDQRAPDDFIVRTRLVTPNDSPGQVPLEVQFRVRTDTGRPVVTDLGVMGIWLALAQRDSFGAYLGGHGGSVAALTDHVRSVTAQVR